MGQNRLHELRKAKGFSLEALADRVGTTKMQIQRLEKGTRRLSDHWIYRLAPVLGVSPGMLLESGVPVVGKIGAGGCVAFNEVLDLGVAPRPPDTDGDLIGLEVEGESMLPKFDPGDVIYIEPSPEGVDPAFLGAYCACRLITGETFLKILARGSKPGFFNLRSLNAAEMEDRELLWATPVRAILPRFARRL
jgi:transcriptional regulator with XRE-family HTH domain